MSAKLQEIKGVRSPRLVASQMNGAAGARALIAKTTHEQRQVWREKGGAALLALYGRDFFSYISKLRWEKYRKQKAKEQ